MFPNGVCLTHDGEHILVASTWTCSLLIFDLKNLSAGPRRFLASLPGYPDNVNRASDGGYWVALAGMRNPVMDLVMRYPGLRRRMTRAVAPTHWLFGNLNIGGVLKIDGAGRIVDAYWDTPSGPLYMITSMREHKGALYLGGVTNNKIGRLRLPGADPGWTGPDSYWGKGSVAPPWRKRRTSPSMTLEGVLGPNNRLEEARGLPIESPDTLSVGADGRLFVSAGRSVLYLRKWGEAPQACAEFERPVTALTSSKSGMLAVGTLGGGLRFATVRAAP